MTRKKRKRSTDRPLSLKLEKAAGDPRPSHLCQQRSQHHPETVVLALGSNLGDRQVHLRRAVRALSRVMSVVCISSVWETDPIGCSRKADAFLNLVLGGWTTLSPAALLEAIESVELLGGRRRRLPNDPRTIDVDILFYGNRGIRQTGLVVPHPRFRERNFVLEPLREIAGTIPIPAFAGPLSALHGLGDVRSAGSLY